MNIARGQESNIREWINTLVRFEDSLVPHRLIERIRMLAGRAQAEDAATDPTTVDALVSMNFAMNSKDERSITFNFMRIRAKRIRKCDYEEDGGQRRVPAGKKLRGTEHAKLTFGAVEFAQAEFKQNGGTVKLESLRKKWGRMLSYGAWLIESMRVFGGYAIWLVLPIEAVCPNRKEPQHQNGVRSAIHLAPGTEGRAFRLAQEAVHHQQLLYWRHGH